MPRPFFAKLVEAGVPLPELEALWARAGGAAARYDGGAHYAVATKIFENMVNAYYPDQWRAYVRSKSESRAGTALALEVSGDCAGRFAEMLRFLEKTTMEGGGVTLSYEANDGQRGTLYMDGDGQDRVRLL